MEGEGEGERDIPEPESRGSPGRRWLGSEAVAAAAAAYSQRALWKRRRHLGWVASLMPPSANDCSYSRRCGSEKFSQCTATNGRRGPSPQLGCVTLMLPEPGGSSRTVPLVFALKSLMEMGGGMVGHQKKRP